MAQDTVSTKVKFWIGFLGGLTPYALGVATFLFASANIEEMPGVFPVVAKTVAIVIYASMGGLLSYIWDNIENDRRKLFFIGMAAPSILLSWITNIQDNIPQRPDIGQEIVMLPENHDASTLDLEGLFLTTNLASPNYSDYQLHEAIEENRQQGFTVFAQMSNSMDEEVSFRKMLSGFLDAAGLTGMDTFFFLITAILLFFLLTKALAVRKSLRAHAVFRDELSRPDPDINALQNKIREIGLTPREAASLLDKGDPMEKGLAALGSDQFQNAVASFTDVIRRVSDAFFFRAYAHDHLNEHEKALGDIEKFLEVNPNSERVGWALYNKGVSLMGLDRSADAIAVYDQLIERFGTSELPDVQEPVARAFFNKGVTLGELDRSADAIAVYDQLIERIGTSELPAMQEQVAMALVNKAQILNNLGQLVEAASIADDVIERFGSSNQPALLEHVKKAQSIKNND